MHVASPRPVPIPVAVAVALACRWLESGPDRDVYACGVFLWELLTGRASRPLERPEAFAACRLVGTHAELPFATDLRVDCPAALDDIIGRATAVANLRFASGAEMCAALASAVPLASDTQVLAWLGVSSTPTEARSS